MIYGTARRAGTCQERCERNRYLSQQATDNQLLEKQQHARDTRAVGYVFRCGDRCSVCGKKRFGRGPRHATILALLAREGHTSGFLGF